MRVELIAAALAAVFLARTVALQHELRATEKLVHLTAQQLKKTRTGDTTSSPSSDLMCDACKIIVGLLDTLYQENKTEDEIVAVSTEICIDLHIEDRNVCTLVVKEFKVW